MTDIRTWPSREEWEAEERSRAEYTIEHGVNGWDYCGDHPQYNEDERSEVDGPRTGSHQDDPPQL
jgi:hypothetical protein